ncbi:28S ribosomal protein S18c, mitochondrial [Galendromus occidentalis]|uniref:28S ribosomal protein S18c, mitochondrial n=1 Tax=Galendromus occidentalis TaxID=34638 RepID=A0AAJ6QX01_9ACAR|nr:28S ribosomal protein S18c, mitochondrial [Galendromus occidentalis]
MLRTLIQRGTARTGSHLCSTVAASTPSPGVSNEAAAGETNSDEPIWDMENPFKKTRRECILCRNKIEVDYKNTQLLSQFVSNYTGELYQKHITGLCEHQHQKVRLALHHAQCIGILPHYHKDLRFIRDPKLFDPLHPQRPNPH